MMRTISVLVAFVAAVTCKQAEAGWQQQMLFRERLMAGAGARGTAQTFLHPIDVLRTRLQAKGVKVQWTPQTFLKGVAPQMILAVPAGALQFASYEWGKAQCKLAGVTGAGSEILCGALG